tara:strand:+ start:425 stop:1444 length:1020 start_codon:yes stop_codon:yes gene_type:complete
MKQSPDGVIYSVKGTKISKEERNFFENTNPFGFILFERNFSDKKQIKSLIHELKNITRNKNLFVSVDQEGGRVQRFRNNQFFKYSPQKKIGEIYKKNKVEAILLAKQFSYFMGLELKKINIDINFSPVADLFFTYGNEIIGDRSFGTDPNLVFELSSAFFIGFVESGIIPVLKHFPGHGRSETDTHKSFSIVAAERKELIDNDILPFKKTQHQFIVMLAHILYPNLDCEIATYSKIIIKDILREHCGFLGIVLSDDISMLALSEKLESKIIKSYTGGCDVVLYCKADLKEMEKIQHYVRPIKKKFLDYFFKQYYKIKIKQYNYNEIKNRLIDFGLINID